MQDAAFERCGTVGSAYMQEPVSGSPAEVKYAQPGTLGG